MRPNPAAPVRRDALAAAADAPLRSPRGWTGPGGAHPRVEPPPPSHAGAERFQTARGTWASPADPSSRAAASSSSGRPGASRAERPGHRGAARSAGGPSPRGRCPERLRAVAGRCPRTALRTDAGPSGHGRTAFARRGAAPRRRPGRDQGVAPPRREDHRPNAPEARSRGPDGGAHPGARAVRSTQTGRWSEATRAAAPRSTPEAVARSPGPRAKRSSRATGRAAWKDRPGATTS